MTQEAYRWRDIPERPVGMREEGRRVSGPGSCSSWTPRAGPSARTPTPTPSRPRAHHSGRQRHQDDRWVPREEASALHHCSPQTSLYGWWWCMCGAGIRNISQTFGVGDGVPPVSPINRKLLPVWLALFSLTRAAACALTKLDMLAGLLVWGAIPIISRLGRS